VSNNNDLDPAASTQMFRAFVEGGTPNAPTPTEQRTSGSGNLGKVIGAVVVIVVIAVVAYIALH
jgi:hypothetical protein